MGQVIRRERRQPKRGRILGAGAALLAMAGGVGVLALAWAKGAPQPQRDMTVALPAPKVG